MKEQQNTTPIFSKQDLIQIQNHQLSEEIVLNQLKIFKEGIPPVSLTAPATIGNGILKLSKSTRQEWVKRYERSNCSTIKFVPASGAASRMFKLLHAFVQHFNPEKDRLKAFLQTSKYHPLAPLFGQMEALPFYQQLRAEVINNHPDIRNISSDIQKYLLVQYLMESMDYPNLPKGLIPFHQYYDKTVTAFEEHLREAIAYSSKNHRAVLHFTIPEGSLSLFENTIKHIEKRISNLKTDFEISYSFQNQSTDTIAVDEANTPFRDLKGRLIFRPGGHGALIENLNTLDADIIFIKNIDNVVTEKSLPELALYKKALAGFLLKVQSDIFELLERIEKDTAIASLKSDATKLAKTYFQKEPVFSNPDEIYDFFNRPIRVCGMVKNEGEPGGGPFWVKDENGGISLQIIEKAQIDTTNPLQKEILAQSTHFNPVDLVCGVRNYKGEKFDLTKFVNPNRGFITNKSKNGRPLKALELPGLWNGGMAHWHTLFVEVPSGTFNPVKTVIDLLKPSHQVAMDS